MTVWIIIGGTYYENMGWVGGVFSTKEKAKLAMDAMTLSEGQFMDLVECDEVDDPKSAEIIDGRYS